MVVYHLPQTWNPSCSSTANFLLNNRQPKTPIFLSNYFHRPASFEVPFWPQTAAARAANPVLCLPWEMGGKEKANAKIKKVKKDHLKAPVASRKAAQTESGSKSHKPKDKARKTSQGKQDTRANHPVFRKAEAKKAEKLLREEKSAARTAAVGDKSAKKSKERKSAQSEAKKETSKQAKPQTKLVERQDGKNTSVAAGKRKEKETDASKKKKEGKKAPKEDKSGKKEKVPKEAKQAENEGKVKRREQAEEKDEDQKKEPRKKSRPNTSMEAEKKKEEEKVETDSRKSALRKPAASEATTTASSPAASTQGLITPPASTGFSSPVAAASFEDWEMIAQKNGKTLDEFMSEISQEKLTEILEAKMNHLVSQQKEETHDSAEEDEPQERGLVAEEESQDAEEDEGGEEEEAERDQEVSDCCGSSTDTSDLESESEKGDEDQSDTESALGTMSEEKAEQLVQAAFGDLVGPESVASDSKEAEAAKQAAIENALKKQEEQREKAMADLQKATSTQAQKEHYIPPLLRMARHKHSDLYPGISSDVSSAETSELYSDMCSDMWSGEFMLTYSDRYSLFCSSTFIWQRVWHVFWYIFW